MANITGWGRGTWGEGAWNAPLAVEVTGVAGTTALGNETVVAQTVASVDFRDSLMATSFSPEFGLTVDGFVQDGQVINNGSNTEDITNAERAQDIFLAAEMDLPSSFTKASAIWDCGSTGTGAWFGISEQSGAYFLRLRGGTGTDGTNTAGTNLAIAQVAVTSLSQFFDGNTHTVAWGFDISAGRAVIFIDGQLVADGTTSDGSSLGSGFAGGATGAFGFANGAAGGVGDDGSTQFQSNDSFTGTIRSDLRMYKNEFFTAQTNSTQTGTSVVAVTGVAGTSALGNEVSFTNVVVVETGLAGTTALGNVVSDGGAVATVTGLAGTSALGNTTETGTGTFSVTGVAGTSAVGNAQAFPEFVVGATGNAGTGAVGNASISGTCSFSVTGVAGTSALGEETIAAGASVVGGDQRVSFTALANAQISTDQNKFSGSSLELDGTNDRIQSTDITLGTDSYTWETFVRFNSLSSSQCIWDAGENVGASQNPVVYITSTNIQISYAGGTYINVAHGMSTNTWHHIAIVRDGTGSSNLKAYIDGTNVGTGSLGSLGSGATNHVIGGNFAGTFTTNGYFDETRLTRRVIYSSNFTPPSSQLDTNKNDVFLLRYNGSDGSTQIDNDAEVGLAATGETGTTTVIPSIEVVPTGVSSTGGIGDVLAAAGAKVVEDAVTGTVNLGDEAVSGGANVSVTGVVGTGGIRTDDTGTVTFTVTVLNDGGGNKYYIDGVKQDTLTLIEGKTYRFDQSAASNSGHPLRLSTTSNGTHGGGTEYTTGVTTNGTPGTSGAYTEITVATGAPTLYYYCSVHSGMGGQINTNASSDLVVSGTAVFAVTGSAGTSALGTASAAIPIIVSVTGFGVTSSLGTVTSSVVSNVVVSGVQGTGVAARVNLYGLIANEVSVSYTEVTPSQNANWAA